MKRTGDRQMTSHESEFQRRDHSTHTDRNPKQLEATRRSTKTRNRQLEGQ
nr:MAG TPA: hypothetical protein [Caudoviricetes sp.]